MQTVLILGNGLSRLAFDEAIRAYDGPVWGCNRVFLDYGDKITALAGHADVMEEARAWRDSNNKKFDIFGIDDALTCPAIFKKDTGTTLVAEALTRGYDVIVAGFDLGGADLYSPGHEKKNKTSWVTRWRLIFSRFDPDRVTFLGYDHKPFLLSNRSAQEYYRKYIRGEAHIPTDEYKKSVESWTGDYSRIWERIPHAALHNIGLRDWKFLEADEPLPAGGRLVLPEFVAKKYAELYPREFKIETVA